MHDDKGNVLAIESNIDNIKLVIPVLLLLLIRLTCFNLDYSRTVILVIDSHHLNDIVVLCVSTSCI
jgi:hypothetical protein